MPPKAANGPAPEGAGPLDDDDSDEFGQVAQQCGLGLGPDDLLDDLAPGKHVQRRDLQDPVTLSDLGVLVDVQLHDTDLVAVLGGDLLEHRGDHPARTAPFGPVVTTTGFSLLSTSVSKVASVTVFVAPTMMTPCLRCEMSGCRRCPVSSPGWPASVRRRVPRHIRCRPR